MTSIRPGGYSDLNLQSNVYFVLAGPCELQLHICKEFDQIPFSKCLKPGFWAILFYICMLCLSIFFGTFSSKGFFVQLSTSSLKQVFLLDPPPLPLLRICPNSSHITSVLTIVTAAISCQRELYGSLQCHVHIHACQLYCDLCQLVWLKIQSLQGKTASACHRMSSA